LAWNCLDLDECEEAVIQKKTWDIDGTETNIDSTFLYKNDQPYLFKVLKHEYDDYGNYINYNDETFTAPDNQGNQTKTVRNYYYELMYHEIYDEIESEGWWYKLFKDNRWDSILEYKIEYYDWWDVTKPVSITEHKPASDAALSIVPNPTDGQLTIDNGQWTIDNIEVYDVFGRCVGTHYSLLTTHYSIDISGLPSGVYFLRITTGNGVVTRKVIKN
jgi:hypothetical protein